jgi:hypothetical protein
MFRLGLSDGPRNGTFVHPAVVTRVHRPDVVNVIALIDLDGARPFGSVAVRDYEPAEHAAQQVCWVPDA